MDALCKRKRMVGIQQWVAVGESEQEPGLEAELLRAGKAGDPRALESLLALHKRSLLALCYGILGHLEDAEDAAQETFLRALRALPRFRSEAAFRTWLFRIGINVCLKWKASRPPTEPWAEEQTGIAPETASPEIVALRHLQVMEALDSLPRRLRVILLLKVLEGWSVAEIGAALGWNSMRVQNELARARRALADWRRGAGEGEPR
jgi:RNA polymerase sigma-70 factor (ECF subfamily)